MARKLPSSKRRSSQGRTEPEQAASPSEKSSGIKIRRLSIRNYKAIDELHLAFPAPKMPVDPDITVIGSKNGVGKTSVLESCVLLIWGAILPRTIEERRRPPWGDPSLSIPLANLMIRAGRSSAAIQGIIQVDQGEYEIRVNIHEDGIIDPNYSLPSPKPAPFREFRRFLDHAGQEGFLISLLGFDADPLLVPPVLYFHSYRKVIEGGPKFESLLEDSPSQFKRASKSSKRPPERMAGAFKAAVLQAIMSKAGIFEAFSTEESDVTLEKANILMKQFAGGVIEKLRPSGDNTIELRVSPTGGGPSFSFDGLSSGQKEIISTLFLVWQYTQKQPGIVLIDEPELHLNAEWHRGFVRGLIELAPENQYIIATHSEDVFASVEPDRRVLLVGPEK